MISRKLISSIAVMAVIACGCVNHRAAVDNACPIRVLLLSGMNNHNWQETTPALKKIYEDSGRFTVDVIDTPLNCKEQSLDEYDVIVSNWTNFPAQERVWGEQTEEAFLDFVRAGKGFVLFHAASACFYSWPEYHQLIGGTWGENTDHGPPHRFAVSIEDKQHPVTRGMKDFAIADELWHRMELQPSAQILCRAFSAVDKGGTGEMEPVVIYTDFGKGRCFNLVLGHDTGAMSNVNWRTLMLRGTEWAATGSVQGEVRE